MTKCSICNSEHCAAIDSLLDAGTNQKTVAEQFQLSRFAISRHARHSKLAPTPETSISEPLEVQAARWMERADAIYQASTINGDVRGQAQSLQVAFRGLELQHRAELRAAETTPENGEMPVTIEEIDRIVRSAIGDRQSKLIDKIFAAPEATLTAVESILESRVS